MARDPFDALESVVDEESFIEFLSVLSADWADEVAKERAKPSPPYGPGANGWENGTIDMFLDAAAAWAAASINGTSTYTKSANPWRRCAEILYMGKIYE